MELKGIGKRIREKRLEKSWSQEDLAERVNLSAVYIGMIERGEKLPKLETFIRIANVLEVSSDELLVDVINQGFEIQLSKYTEQIGKLDMQEQKRIYKIIEAYLQAK